MRDFIFGLILFLSLLNLIVGAMVVTDSISKQQKSIACNYKVKYAVPGILIGCYLSEKTKGD